MMEGLNNFVRSFTGSSTTTAGTDTTNASSKTSFFSRLFGSFGGVKIAPTENPQQKRQAAFQEAYDIANKLNIPNFSAPSQASRTFPRPPIFTAFKKLAQGKGYEDAEAFKQHITEHYGPEIAKSIFTPTREANFKSEGLHSLAHLEILRSANRLKGQLSTTQLSVNSNSNLAGEHAVKAERIAKEVEELAQTINQDYPNSAAAAAATAASKEARQAADAASEASTASSSLSSNNQSLSSSTLLESSAELLGTATQSYARVLNAKAKVIAAGQQAINDQAAAVEQQKIAAEEAKKQLVAQETRKRRTSILNTIDTFAQTNVSEPSSPTSVVQPTEAQKKVEDFVASMEQLRTSLQPFRDYAAAHAMLDQKQQSVALAEKDLSLYSASIANTGQKPSSMQTATLREKQGTYQKALGEHAIAKKIFDTTSKEISQFSTKQLAEMSSTATQATGVLLSHENLSEGDWSLKAVFSPPALTLPTVTTTIKSIQQSQNPQEKLTLINKLHTDIATLSKNISRDANTYLKFISPPPIAS